nr:hypothetical protein [Allomuricauda sp.]
MKIRNIIVTLIAITTIYAAAKSPEKNIVTVQPFDVASVVFIEDVHEDELCLGFNTAEYLPENFDPYAGEFSLDAINYIEENDEVELNFDTSGYLPNGFDPYIQ